MGNIDNTDLIELLKEATRVVDDAIESRPVIYNTPSGRFELNPKKSIVPDRKLTLFERFKLQWDKLFK